MNREKQHLFAATFLTNCIKGFLILFALAVIAQCPAASAADGDFIPLFNGKDLNGWLPIGNPDAFTVKDESICSTGAGPYPVWLRTVREYENFEFRFEYKTEGWSENGVLFHAPLYGPPSKIGFKIHLRHDNADEGLRTTGAIYDVAAPLQRANKPGDEWNKMEVLCDWPTLRIKMNGVVIHDIDQSEHPELRYRLRRGYLGIQGLGCKAYYRNIEIRELPDKEKWNNLFEGGMDRLTTREECEWSIRNGILTGTGFNGYAVTKDIFEKPTELQVWVKTMPNGNGGVFCYWHDESSADKVDSSQRGFEVQCYNCPDSTMPTGSIYGISGASHVVTHDEEWFFMQVFTDGPWAMVRVNGEKVAETDSLKPPHKGRITFQQHTHPGFVQYRDARARTISAQ